MIWGALLAPPRIMPLVVAPYQAAISAARIYLEYRELNHLFAGKLGRFSINCEIAYLLEYLYEGPHED